MLIAIPQCEQQLHLYIVTYMTYSIAVLTSHFMYVIFCILVRFDRRDRSVGTNWTRDEFYSNCNYSKVCKCNLFSEVYIKLVIRKVIRLIDRTYEFY